MIKTKDFENQPDLIRVATHSITPGLFGLPIRRGDHTRWAKGSTFDLDIWLAIQALCSDLHAEDKVLENPIKCSTTSLLRSADKVFGTSASRLDASLHRLTQIAVDKMGPLLNSVNSIKSDNQEAVYKHYLLELSPWVLEEFNFRPWRYVDYGFYKSLRCYLSKILYLSLDTMFYMACKKLSWKIGETPVEIEKDYATTCEETGLVQRSYGSTISTQMGKSLEELLLVGYLSKWELLRRKRRLYGLYKLVFRPGDLFFAIHASKFKSKLSSPGLHAVPSVGSSRESQEDVQTLPDIHGVGEEVRQQLLALLYDTNIVFSESFRFEVIPREADWKSLDKPSGLSREEFLDWLKVIVTRGGAAVLDKSPHQDDLQKLFSIKFDFEQRNRRNQILDQAGWLVSVILNPAYEIPSQIKAKIKKLEEDRLARIQVHNDTINTHLKNLEEDFLVTEKWRSSPSEEKTRMLSCWTLSHGRAVGLLPASVLFALDEVMKICQERLRLEIKQLKGMSIKTTSSNLITPRRFQEFGDSIQITNQPHVV